VHKATLMACRTFLVIGHPLSSPVSTYQLHQDRKMSGRARPQRPKTRGRGRKKRRLLLLPSRNHPGDASSQVRRIANWQVCIEPVVGTTIIFLYLHVRPTSYYALASGRGAKHHLRPSVQVEIGMARLDYQVRGELSWEWCLHRCWVVRK